MVKALENLILYKIVIRGNENCDKFSENETLALNLDFSHESARIACNVSMKKGGKGVLEDPCNTEMEKEKNNDGGGVQQESLIDAAIVSVMKSRKMMKLNDLLSDVVKLLPWFRPQPKQMKNRIESLIERGYMKRNDKDLGVFIYLP